MSGTFTILHLSDSHIGKPGSKYDSTSVLDPLLDDIEAGTKSYGEPALIIFSGDLVHGDPAECSLEQQYDLARTFLSNVCTRAQGQLGSIPLCIVPGNHDVDRSRVDSNQKIGRDALDANRVHDMMSGNDAITWERILDRQKRWFDFSTTLPSTPVSWHKQWFASHQIIEHCEKRIGVAGFNTSWACHEDGEQGKLWLGRDQYNAIQKEISECDFRIASSHHPVHWLACEDQTFVRDRLQSQFHLYLHGHDHSQWFLDAYGHLVVEAGACYEGAKKPNAYSWITIDLNAKRACLHLRTYSDRGASGWIPYHIPAKTDAQGYALISCLFQSGNNDGEQSNEIATASVQPNLRPPREKPANLFQYIYYLQRHHLFRWEQQSLPEPLGSPIIYWPVKLRRPTPIHAAQAFTAAGLQQHGCEIHLWIDDLGNTECDQTLFTRFINRWFTKAGGNTSDIRAHSFKQVVQSPDDTRAWAMVEKWLSTRHYRAKQVLEISKIVSEDGKPDDIAREISQRRPGRLMTPAMVWVCLQHLCLTERQCRIITLGGFDEQGLWNAWHQCVELPEIQLGHLFVSKLQHKSETFSLAQSGDSLYWTSRQDIERTFKKSLADAKEPSDQGAEHHQLIPWCLNNCAALPRFIRGEDILQIGSKTLTGREQYVDSAVEGDLDDCVEAVSTWLL